MAREFRKYEIKITRIDIENAIQKVWMKTADSGNPKDGGAFYEYVDKTVEDIIKTEILTQEIREENLDIKTIIKAINNL